MVEMKLYFENGNSVEIKCQLGELKAVFKAQCDAQNSWIVQMVDNRRQERLVQMIGER